MAGETDLGNLLAGMAPQLHEGAYVFCVVGEMPSLQMSDIVCFFREAEGWTLVLERGVAEKLLVDDREPDGLSPGDLVSGSLPAGSPAAGCHPGVECGPPMAWITLTVHSSLEAVGLTAAVSAALAAGGMSCNVIAAYYHDHIFVAHGDAAAAMEILRGLTSDL